MSCGPNYVYTERTTPPKVRPDDMGQGFVDPSHTQYMNMGWRETPYPGKVGQGDYGPPQGGQIYYRPGNPVYPYGLRAWVPPTQYAQPGPPWMPRR